MNGKNMEFQPLKKLNVVELSNKPMVVNQVKVAVNAVP